MMPALKFKKQKLNWRLSARSAGSRQGCAVSFFAFIRAILNSSPTAEWRTQPMMTIDVESLKERINQLHIEHRDLDDVISRLSQSAAQDQLQLQRLKKRKLYLKDQIALLERQLTPDIPA
jgi:hypothetical protein